MHRDRGGRLVEGFFAPPNQLRLEDLREGSEPAAAAPSRLVNQLVEDARAGDGRPLLLPRADDEGTTWYALMPNRRLRRMIAEDIKAFVGLTYADLGEMSEPLNSDDPLDAAALEWIGDDGAALRFRVPVPQRRSAIGAIAAMRRAWDERPRHQISVPYGTAAMLRTLNRAIASRDSAIAEAVLDRVRSSGRLSSANVTFSTIRVLEVGGRWAEIFNLDEIGVVLAIPRPRTVTEALLRAVYWTEVADDAPLGGAPNADQFAGAVAVMRDIVLPRYSALFRAAEGLRAGEALLLFALRAAAAVPPRPEEIERLAEGCDVDDPARPTIEAVGRHIDSVTRDAEVLPSGDSSFAAEAVRGQLRRAAEERKGRIREAQSALEVFGRGPSVDTASDSLVVLSRLSPNEQEEMDTVHRYQAVAARVRGLIAPGESHLPGGWVSWAQGLSTAPDWSGASDVLELAADTWAIDPLLESGAAEDFALALMDARSQGGRDAAARALDHLVPAADAALARGLDVSALGARLITVLLADEVVTEADWNFVVGLLDAVLEGINPAGYAEILDEVRSSLADRASPTILDVSLAVLETSAFHHAPDPTALNALAGVIIGLCDRFSHRLHRDQLAILEIIARDLGGGYEGQARDLAARLSSDADARINEEETLLDGQFIGIYSLEESAVARAKEVIESAYRGVRVEADASKVATQGLRRMAQTADHVIVATRAAKHAATLEIDLILRKRGLRPIFPAGKGATSIVRALRDRLAEA